MNDSSKSIIISELDESYTLSKGVEYIIRNLIDGCHPNDDGLASTLYALSNLVTTSVDCQKKALDKIAELKTS